MLDALVFWEKECLQSHLQTVHEEGIGEVKRSYDGPRHIIGRPCLHLAFNGSSEVYVVWTTVTQRSARWHTATSDRSTCPTWRSSTSTPQTLYYCYCSSLLGLHNFTHVHHPLVTSQLFHVTADLLPFYDSDVRLHLHSTWLSWVRLNVPVDTLYVISETTVYRSN